MATWLLFYCLINTSSCMYQYLLYVSVSHISCQIWSSSSFSKRHPQSQMNNTNHTNSTAFNQSHSKSSRNLYSSTLLPISYLIGLVGFFYSVGKYYKKRGIISQENGTLQLWISVWMDIFSEICCSRIYKWWG